MLLGANDGTTQDKLMQVTIAFNRFGKGLVQRMPRCRWGFFHVINNYYSHWEMYAIGGSANPTIISQGNRYKASNNLNTKQVRDTARVCVCLRYVHICKVSEKTSVVGNQEGVQSQG